MRIATLASIFVGFFFLVACLKPGSSGGSATASLEQEKLAKIHCSGCHAFPGPELLTQNMWKSVLPHMSARLGVPSGGLNPFKNMKTAEISRLKMGGVYPEKPLIPDSVWKSIESYYLSEAPESMRLPVRKTQDNESPFEARMQPLELNSSAFISMVKFDPEEQLFVATWNGDVVQVDGNFGARKKVVFPRPIVDFQYDDQGYIKALSIGELYPNEGFSGAVAQLDTQSFSQPELVFAQLARPVSFESGDLNGDGREDLLICQFGNKLGQLSWFENTGQTYQEHVIKEAPGATRAYLLDMDDDGDLDPVALFAQGDEGISIFYNEKGRFREERILRFHPVFGSSDFEFLDFDRDGDRDIIMTNGDNADYSNMLKSFHGVRIFLNEEGEFKEKFFFPMFGASKVRARDYDQDGDLDLLACAFFPETTQGLDQSIVYLENKGNWIFEASHFELAPEGRWMVMDAGDVDQDGDVDVILGSFVLTSEGVPQAILNQWRNSRNQILVLENKTSAPPG